jgi:hypothetical protein
VPILTKSVDPFRKSEIFNRAVLVAKRASEFVKVYFIDNDAEIKKAKGFLFLAVGRLLSQCNIAKMEWRSYMLKFGAEAAGNFFSELIGNHVFKSTGSSGNLLASKTDIPTIS